MKLNKYRVAVFSGVTALFCAGLIPAYSEAVDSTENSHRVFSGAVVRKIAVRNTTGNIEIRGWQAPDIDVTAIKTAFRSERMPEASIEETIDGDTLAVSTNYSSSELTWNNTTGVKSDNPPSVAYTILVPRTVESIDVSAVSGRVEVSLVNCSVGVRLVNGSLIARDLQGNTKLSTINAFLSAAFPSGGRTVAASLSSVNGHITVSVSDPQTAIAAKSEHGRVIGGTGKPRSTESSASLSSKIVVENVNGDIYIERF